MVFLTGSSGSPTQPARPSTAERSRPLVNRHEIRLGMIGMVEGNGHAYSWSAIINGYDPEAMALCPFPRIPVYLAKQPRESFGIAGVAVTHVFSDEPEAAQRVADACFIPKVVRSPEDLIGNVDAVIIATDVGSEHVARCRAFVEAGVPLFVDKPLVDNEGDLEVFRQWVEGHAAILSSSAMRYCKEFLPFRDSAHDLGQLQYVSATATHSWERYGIHAMEAVYPILGPGFLSASNTGTITKNIVHFKHRGGADVVIAVARDLYPGAIAVSLCGTAGEAHAACSDLFYAFKAQLRAFVEYLRTGVRPYPFAETVELMVMLIAGIRSREAGGREVPLTVDDTWAA